MTDPPTDTLTLTLTLQITATIAIVVFGLFQMGAVIFGAKGLRKHYTMLQERHEETMTRLEDRRADAQRQHEVTMAVLQDQRADAQRQHEEVMAAWGAVDERDKQSSATSEYNIGERVEAIIPPQGRGH